MIVFSRREALPRRGFSPWEGAHFVSSPAPQVLAGLLHLGNIWFADSEDEAQPCQLMDNAKCEGKGQGLHLRLWSHSREQGRPCLEKERALAGLGGRPEGEIWNLMLLMEPSAVGPCPG